MTIADLAAACGVSRWTVSAVLFPSEKNRHVGVSDATRTAVTAAAERLRYRPHRASRKLLARQTSAIGILTSSFFSVPWTSIHAMLRSATAHGQVISFESIADDAGELPLFVREHVVDGLIVFEPMAPRIEAAIAHHRIPLVQVNTSRRGQRDSIVMDEAGAIGSAVAHLAEGGRKEIALIVAHGEALFEQERMAALKRACTRARITPRVLPFAGVDTRPPDGHRHLSAFLAQHPGIDAVIAPHDAFVGMLYRWALEQGRRIPADLAVVCMQDPDRLLHLVPPVSAFELPEARLGELAVETLQRRLSGAEPLPEVVLPYHFTVRGSTQ